MLVELEERAIIKHPKYWKLELKVSQNKYIEEILQNVQLEIPDKTSGLNIMYLSIYAAKGNGKKDEYMSLLNQVSDYTEQI